MTYAKNALAGRFFLDNSCEIRYNIGMKVRNDNMSEYRKQSKLYKTIEKDNHRFVNLLEDLLSMSDESWEFLNQFPLAQQKNILACYLSYKDFSRIFLMDWHDGLYKNRSFPYIDYSEISKIARSIYDSLRGDTQLIKGYTDEYILALDNDEIKTTFDHVFIPQQSASKMILELMILLEEGVYDINTFIYNMGCFSQQVGVTTTKNTNFKKNLDEKGLRYYPHDKFKYGFIKDASGNVVDFQNDLDRPFFISDVIPSKRQIQNYTNRMSIKQDSKALKNLGKPLPKLVKKWRCEVKKLKNTLNNEDN